MGKNNRPKSTVAEVTPEVTPEVVEEVVEEVVTTTSEHIETPEVVEVPVVVFPNVVVYDSEDGLALKVVTAREARHPRYKPV